MAPTDGRLALLDRTSQRSVPVWLIALVVALIVARMAFSWRDGGKSDLVEWIPLEEAVMQSKLTGKPIMFNFTAAWCGPCHELENAVFRDATLAAMINQRFIPVQVVDRQREDGRNAPEVDELQQRFTVRAFPTLIFADESGTARARMEGFRDRTHFERTVEQLR